MYTGWLCGTDNVLMFFLKNALFALNDSLTQDLLMLVLSNNKVSLNKCGHWPLLWGCKQRIHINIRVDIRMDGLLAVKHKCCAKKERSCFSSIFSVLSRTALISRHFADNILKFIFLYECCCIFHPNFPNAPINNKSLFVLIVSWRRAGNKLSSGPKMDGLVNASLPQWVNFFRWACEHTI